MNIFLLRQFRKNYYIDRINKSNMSKFERYLMILQMILLGIFIYFRVKIENYFVSYIVVSIINLNCIIGIIIKKIYIDNHLKEGLINDITKSYVKKINIGLCGVIIYTVIIILVAILNNQSSIFQPIWVWCGFYCGLSYIDSVYMSSIIILDDNNYYSGIYKIEYSSITKIEKVNTYYTVKGEIELIKIYSNDLLIGFDKLFSEDYCALCEKINNLNR